ncbi:hypothetical protein SNE26_13350 [Mucilaginibacter sp. cycad4]|uniref:hypothetical protein n=1 Tax=Mucilaginibacter sp. cycad4 TaxID=3342096 RepID=UPI002AAA99FD|nr:hypothetical protein [Mucilaginibacter gossypii]WPV02768.1 hypothetical protein SNE26_13350 [Mucilaginibacter gossypii]
MKKKFFLTALVFAAGTLSCFAQLDNPCDNADGDATCPLDTWVIVLAAAVFTFAAIHLYRKQKSLQA